MSVKSSEYWAKRFEMLATALLDKGERYAVDAEREYKKAIEELEADIAKWYMRFAKNNSVSLSEAKKMLNAEELEELKWTVEEYIKAGKENAVDQRWMKELENASARAHISRLESLKLQVQQQIEMLYSKHAAKVAEVLSDIYTDGYYRTTFEIQRGTGIGTTFELLDQTRVEKVLSRPWTTDDKTFSDRIWQDKAKLLDSIQTHITQSCIRGDDPAKAIAAVAKEMNTSSKVAGRLVMTESAFFASEAQRDCFEELGVKRYQVLGTLDLHTCDECGDMDKRVFDMSDRQVGVTAPPFHPNCRCTTVPYFEGLSGTRAARGADGKTHQVRGDITYTEWYEQYVVKRVENEYKGLVGIESANGLRLSGISDHVVERAIQRGVKASDVQDALLNPLKIGKIKKRENGVSVEYVGENARVIVNPETGNLITVWKTSTRLRNKLKGMR